MKMRLTVIVIMGMGCGSKDSASRLPEATPFSQLEGDSPLAVTDHHIDCAAFRYQNGGWTELGKFQSKATPVASSGEISRSAQFTSENNVGFSADGNFEEGLLYFGSIYDFDRHTGTQIQKAKQMSIDLTMLYGAFENADNYRLHCDMLAN